MPQGQTEVCEQQLWIETNEKIKTTVYTKSPFFCVHSTSHYSNWIKLREGDMVENQLWSNITHLF